MQNTRRFEMSSHIFIFEENGVVDKKVLIVLHVALDIQYMPH
jgi:hypothetical protein